MSRRGRDAGGTLDLLELLAATPEPPPPPPVLTVPEHPPALAACACLDRRPGFTSPRPGWWVCAGCDLPTAAYAATMVALAGLASPVEAPAGAPVPEQAAAPAVEATEKPAPIPSRERPEWPPRHEPPPPRALASRGPATYSRVTRPASGVVVDVPLTRERTEQLRTAGWCVTPWLDGRAPHVPADHHHPTYHRTERNPR